MADMLVIKDECDIMDIKEEYPDEKDPFLIKQGN